jgi:chromosome segregation ATPase
LAAVTLERDEWKAGAEYQQEQATQLRQQVAALEASLGQVNEWNKTLLQQRDELQQQLEAAVHLPDLRSDLERVAAERDAAREEVRGLQVRAEQAEGDARNAAAKMRHHEHAAARWEAYSQEKNNLLLRADAANGRVAVIDSGFV